jgi:Fe-S-cluster-containing hydrogenase component 2
METCTVGAIQLVNQQAVIDDAICTCCEACVDACPNRAIVALNVPVEIIPIVALPEAESQIVPVESKIVPAKAAMPAGGITPWAVAALAYLGRELTPRLVDGLVTVLERRLEQPVKTSVTPSVPSSKVLTSLNRGRRRQVRRRGRCRDNMRQ